MMVVPTVDVMFNVNVADIVVVSVPSRAAFCMGVAKLDIVKPRLQTRIDKSFILVQNFRRTVYNQGQRCELARTVNSGKPVSCHFKVASVEMTRHHSEGDIGQALNGKYNSRKQ